MRRVSASCSERGLVRTNNEDAVLVREHGDIGLYLVADGIGGRADGEIASSMLRDGFAHWWKNDFLPNESQGFQSAVENLRQTVLEVNRDLVRRFGEMTSGTTMVLLFIYGTYCAHFSAGDSRIYRWRNLRFRQITKDDVAVGRQQGKLTGAMGIRYTLEFNLGTDTLKNGDRFLLCSDGVYRYVPQGYLLRTVSIGGCFLNPDQIVRQISKEVEKHGAGDNYSMIYVRM